jgi:hypothetical protein
MAARTVTIVCANRETQDDLQAYLRGAGFDSRAVGRIDGQAIEHPPPSVVIVFPDEFDADEVLAEISRLHREQPHVITVIVTRRTAYFASMLAADDKTMVLPKPAWGWTILEAIQSRSPPR